METKKVPVKIIVLLKGCYIHVSLGDDTSRFRVWDSGIHVELPVHIHETALMNLQQSTIMQTCTCSIPILIERSLLITAVESGQYSNLTTLNPRT